MAAPGRVSQQDVTVFEVDGSFVFTHYFDGEAVFSRLKSYYTPHQYPFEVPPTEFDAVRSFLRSRGYVLVLIGSVEEFVVETCTNPPRASSHSRSCSATPPTITVFS